jgi:hypothetical protein
MIPDKITLLAKEAGWAALIMIFLLVASNVPAPDDPGKAIIWLVLGMIGKAFW